MADRTAPWLHIIGIGEDGLDGLSAAALALVNSAEVIVGGDRHHALSSEGAPVNAERIAWPSPFNAMIDKITSLKGRRVVVLVSGDPLWYSVGARIGRAIDPAEICYYPQLSSFQFAAARMGWSLADVETLTIHGRPAEQIIPWLNDGARLLILTKDHTSPASVSGLLCQHGYEKSKLHVLAALGGKDEARFDGVAAKWAHEVPDLHVLAVECIAGENARSVPKTGLPDNAFLNDGNMTKQVVRAATLAKLAPQRGQLLWDIGAGCGTIGIEWMRGAPEARAIGIEPRADRLALCAQNALALGAPALKLVEGSTPDALAGLPAPDAVFIGGGISDEIIDLCLAALKPRGRLVANGVTLESEALLAAAYHKHGGEMQRIQVQTAAPLGSLTGWKNLMPVTQWSWVKPFEATS